MAKYMQEHMGMQKHANAIPIFLGGNYLDLWTVAGQPKLSLSSCGRFPHAVEENHISGLPLCPGATGLHTSELTTLGYFETIIGKCSPKQ